MTRRLIPSYWRRPAAAIAALVAASLFAAATAYARGAESLPEVRLAELPREAQQTLALIQRGGPFPYARDGVVFNNRERILPLRGRGYYHEYTAPTAGARNRGARRIIAGAEGEFYYTDDHYRSFRRIRE
jgi:ribonuclease T1